MPPSLVVLAAGLGSRYGGLKQLEPVGPGGETLLDYAVFDAVRAGFGRVVFVIRGEFEGPFRERVGIRYGGRVKVDYAFQALGDLPGAFPPPPGREKPWGTGHAVWCARGVVDGPFAVINADDFYGADAFAKLAQFLRGQVCKIDPPQVNFSNLTPSFAPRYALVGFELSRTLSEHGAVSRGICEVRAGRLVSVREATGIVAADVGPAGKFTGRETVSMNCWGFTPALFPALESRLAGFLRERGGDLRAEFYLPEAVGQEVAAGRAAVEVLPSSGSWFGVTHREDRPRVEAAIAERVRRGEYPARLF